MMTKGISKGPAAKTATIGMKDRPDRFRKKRRRQPERHPSDHAVDDAQKALHPMSRGHGPSRHCGKPEFVSYCLFYATLQLCKVGLFGSITRRSTSGVAYLLLTPHLHVEHTPSQRTLWGPPNKNKMMTITTTISTLHRTMPHHNRHA